MKIVNQIKYGAIISYISIAVNILAGLIYTPWMVKQLGQSQYGLYTLANSLISLFLVDFGLSFATSRYVSKYHAEGDQEKVDNFLGAIYKLYFIIDALIFVILFTVFLFIDKIYVNLTPEEISKFKVVYLISASFAIFNFPFVTQNGILTAYEKFIPLKLCDLIYRILLVGLTIIVLLLNLGLYAIVGAHAITGLIIILIKFIVLKKIVPVKANFKYKDWGLYKDIFKFSFWTTISILAQRLIFNITPSILGIVASTTAISVFGVVTVVEGYSYTITTAINGMFMPKISKYYANTTDFENAAPKDLNTLFEKVGKFQFWLNGLILVGFVVVGKDFISLWMGNDFNLSYYGILLVILPGLFFNSLQISDTALVVQNKVRIQAIVNVITGVTNIVLSFILSYFYGVIGACISIFIAYSIRAILLNVIASKVVKLNIKSFIKNCYLKMGFSLILSCIACFGLNFLWANVSWVVFILKAVIVVIMYSILTYLISINDEDRTVIKTFFKIKSSK